MEKPTWKNTLCSGYAMHAMGDFAASARHLGYPYFEWNGRVLSSARDNGMHKMGRSCVFPLCTVTDLDQSGGAAFWGNGVSPALQDAKLMAHDMLKATLLEVVSDRIMRATMALVWPDTGDLRSLIKSALTALADESLRGSDSDGSIAVGAAAVSMRVEEAYRLCAGGAT